MRVLCVGRHSFIADHLARFFADLGFETHAAVGLDAAVAAADVQSPDMAVCDYDLLAMLPLDSWERNATLSRIPAIAVSLTRRPNEVNLLDVNGIAGFLYLPAIAPDDVFRVINAATRRRGVTPARSLAWPGAHPASAAQLR